MILYTHILGEGEPIVLLHSGGMTGLVEYEEQAAFFQEQNYQVIRPDLRGHGRSGGTLENYFLRSAKDLYETLEHLQIDRCHIAGVSLGGLVALLFAKKYPGKVRTLTFSGIFPVKRENWEESQEYEAKCHQQLMENEEVVTYMNQIHEKSDWKVLLESWQVKDWYPFDETGEVANLQIPTLCIAGGDSEDEVTAATTFKQLNKNIHIAVIPFAGHLVHSDQPKIYSNILSNFLQNAQVASRI
ncbi:alpha/beta hydrolase [Bacillus tropicus]|uniref:alpha/beta fold hydrolase n=1 Tax=Bacillus tropicus TaxID=2026188 RepID=UPI0008FDE8AE|nr:alpha/beta hydrolase [Bacillus tropicus]MDF9558636.1 alpha/beta hydrolase [Bacillus tropicus]MDF9592188.1 alpha/beta hydrolase [Bacillus tropicus]MDF9646478.1 alpha/beta hydrolase [Bacillus tropicus]OJE38223.1 alpha/beta hydrolase [Bacillus tropicus]